MEETLGEVSKAVSAIGRIDAVPTLLTVLRETTGLRFAAVVRVTEQMWTICAVQDALQLGIEAGAPLVLESNMLFESRCASAPIIVEHTDTKSPYRVQTGSRLYLLKTYISVPIIIPDERYFGNLCAFDSRAMSISGAVALSMLTRFAALIASQLQQQLDSEQEHAALLDERAASELREQFIAILGHDLRNPLQAAYASGEILSRKLADPELLGYTSRIRTNLKRMSALIDDVLDFARGRLGGGVAVHVTEVENVSDALTPIIQELRDGRPGCKILSDISLDRPVHCDTGRLQQVASNLLANAITHGLADSTVKFTVRADDTHLVMQVWNAGQPIPLNSIGKIFQPFWRHSVSASRNGLGLGLHICSEIVRAHGGSISVTSNAADGTLFTARLPLGSKRESISAQLPTRWKPISLANNRPGGPLRK